MAQIEVGDRITAAEELSEGQVYTNNLYQEGDVDYYKLPGTLFGVPSSVNVTFDLNGEKASSSAFKVSFISYDGTTETVLTSKQTAVGTSFQASAATAGKAYYLKVEKDSVYRSFDYNISVDIAPTAESELVASDENNDALAQSDPILGSATYYGKLSSDDLAAGDNGGDWYYFTTGSQTGSTVSLNLSAFTQSTATGALYNVKITDENGQTVTKAGNKTLSTSAGSSDGTLEFEVGATGTPAGTYFVQVTAAVDKSTFESSTENGNNYSLTLSGTTAFNTSPSISVADITSGASGSQKTSASDEFLGFKTNTSTKLSEFISASDAESSTDETQNGLISKYYFKLVGDGTSGEITYTKDDNTAGTISAQASAEGAFTALSLTEFATAEYDAHGSAEQQTIYALVQDNSGVSSTGVETKSDLSGIVAYNLNATDAGITITRDDTDSGLTELTEGSSDSVVFKAELTGTLQSSEKVRLVIATKEDLTIAGNAVTASSNANEYVVEFDTAGSKTFTVTAPSVADSDGTSETVALDYSVVSSDSSSLFSGLKLESNNLIVTENVATISVAEATYSTGSNIEEGKSSNATYVVTATGIAADQTLKLVVAGTKFDFVSDEEFTLTAENNTATIEVRAKENSDVDGNSETGLFDGAITHAIYENNKLLTTYDVADAVISIKDNDVNFAPSAVDDNLSAIEGVKSIVIPGTQLISNDTDANTSDTLTVVSAVKTSAKDSSDNDVPGTLSVSGGNVTFTPENGAFTGDVNLVFNYSVSDGLLSDSGTVTAVLTFIDGKPVQIDETGAYTSTSDVEIITGRSQEADEFIFAKPSTGNLGTDTIKGFEVNVDTLTLTNYTLSDYSVTVDASGNSLVSFVDEGTVTIEAENTASTLGFSQINSSEGISLMLDGATTDTLNISSSGFVTAKNVAEFDSAKVASVTDLSTQIAKGGSSTASNPVDLSDVLAQLKHIVGLKELSGHGFAAGDIDNNNTVDLSDVLAALKHIFGLKKIDTFDIVTEHGLVVDSLTSSSNGELSLVINGDADQSHSDWDIV